MTHDQGGRLPPGDTTAMAVEGPEPVLTPEQWKRLTETPVRGEDENGKD